MTEGERWERLYSALGKVYKLYGAAAVKDPNKVILLIEDYVPDIPREVMLFSETLKNKSILNYIQNTAEIQAGYIISNVKNSLRVPDEIAYKIAVGLYRLLGKNPPAPVNAPKTMLKSAPDDKSKYVSGGKPNVASNIGQQAAATAARQPAGRASVSARQTVGRVTITAKQPAGSASVSARQPAGSASVAASQPAGKASVTARQAAGSSSVSSGQSSQIPRNQTSTSAAAVKASAATKTTSTGDTASDSTSGNGFLMLLGFCMMIAALILCFCVWFGSVSAITGYLLMIALSGIGAAFVFNGEPVGVIVDMVKTFAFWGPVFSSVICLVFKFIGWLFSVIFRG